MLRSINVAFWDALDLSNNIERAIVAVRDVKGMARVAMLISLVIINYALFHLVWYFDLYPTLQWAKAWGSRIVPTITWGIHLSQFIVLSMTLAPTLVELTSARFSRAKLKLMSILVITFIAFDFITDWPYAREFLKLHVDLFAQFGAFATLVEWIVSVLFAILASIGFEVAFVALMSAMLHLALYPIFQNAMALRRKKPLRKPSATYGQRGAGQWPPRGAQQNAGQGARQNDGQQQSPNRGQQHPHHQHHQHNFRR